MKLFLVLLAFIAASLAMFAAEPTVNIYFEDGSAKQYNIDDIEDFNFIDNTKANVMKIHYNKTKVAYYPIEIIAKVMFELDSNSIDRMINVYIAGFPKPYPLINIDSVVFIIDKYQPLTICEQTWMLKNLNIDTYRNGDTVNHCDTDAEWNNARINSEIASSYYDYDPANGDIYGKLYNWFAVKDNRGLAPEGWHVASDEEWKELEMCLGMSIKEADKSLYRGTNQAALLAGRADLWQDGALINDFMFDASGFSAIPGGFAFKYGGFYEKGTNANWWTSTASNAIIACNRKLDYNNFKVYRIHGDGFNGFSVRCIKDK